MSGRADSRESGRAYGLLFDLIAKDPRLELLLEVRGRRKPVVWLVIRHVASGKIADQRDAYDSVNAAAARVLREGQARFAASRASRGSGGNGN